MPATPRILWELSITYKAMALEDKAQDQLTQIVQLGPRIGGDYFQIAKLSVDIGNPEKNTSLATDLHLEKLPPLLSLTKVMGSAYW